jgi:hypothetical protein
MECDVVEDAVASISESFPLSIQRLSQQSHMLQSILRVANNAFSGHLPYNEAMGL